MGDADPRAARTQMARVLMCRTLALRARKIPPDGPIAYQASDRLSFVWCPRGGLTDTTTVWLYPDAQAQGAQMLCDVHRQGTAISHPVVSRSLIS
jgi:hypothetical protein